MDWTITIAGDEKPFASYGIKLEASVLHRRNGAASVLQLHKPGAALGALLASYDQEVIISRDGVPFFVGYCCPPERENDGGRQFIGYELRDWWWKAERIIYHQLWHQVTGIGEGGVKVYTDIPVPNVFLGVALDGTYWTNGEQIEDALEWLIAQGVNIQVGTIDPAVNLFSVEGRSLSCAEVIRNMMAHSPDCQVSTDYSTSPPTVHVRRSSSLTPFTLTAGTDPITAFRLKPRHDLQVPVVVIHFKQTNVIDGGSYPSWTKQVYPPNPGPGTDAAWETQIGAVITTLELEGSQTTYATGSIVTEEILANSADAATRATWWKKFEKPLASDFIDPASLVVGAPISVKDRTGATISLTTYPCHLVDGNPASWMDIATVRDVTIKALVSYNLYSVDVVAYKAAHGGALPPANFIIKQVRDREIHVERTVCDYDSGGEEAFFRTQASFAEGEPEPTGLAQAYYESLATLRYEGTISELHADLPAQNLLTCKLTLAGTALTISDQLIQGTVESLVLGARSISIGPPTVLDITSLMDLHRACRYRRVWNNPQVKVTGDPAGDNGLALGSKTPRQDTTSGNGGLEVICVHYTDGAGKDRQVRLDATGGNLGMPVIHIRQVTAAGGNDSTKGVVEIDSGALSAGQEAKFRAFTKDGVTHYVLATAALDSGGGCFRFKLKSVSADYLTCRTWDGATEGGTDVYIAKAPKLRHVGSESIAGTTWNYTYSAESGYEDGKRVASDGTNSEKQVVIPVYIIGDEIFASTPDAGTDVTVGADELTFLDLNVDGRAWARKFEQ